SAPSATPRYTTGVTGANVVGGPSFTVNGRVVAATSRTTRRAAARPSAGTFTGGTRVMWGTTLDKPRSPRARRSPSISVAAGSGTNNATARRTRASRQLAAWSDG